MKRTKRTKNHRKSPLTIACPSQNDVILGLNGQFPQNIHGNQYLKKMIDVSRERYSLSKSSLEKEGIAITVLQRLIELKPRARILKSTADGKYLEQDESNSLEIIKRLFQIPPNYENKKPKRARVNDKAAANLPAKKEIQSTIHQKNPTKQDHRRRTNTTMTMKPNETTSLDSSSSTGTSSITNADMSHVLNLLINSPPSPRKKRTGSA